MRYECNVSDPMGRKRKVIVETMPGRVSVSTPAGEGFGMDPDQCANLGYVLHAAANDARGDTVSDQRWKLPAWLPA